MTAWASPPSSATTDANCQYLTALPLQRLSQKYMVPRGSLRTLGIKANSSASSKLIASIPTQVVSGFLLILLEPPFFFELFVSTLIFLQRFLSSLATFVQSDLWPTSPLGHTESASVTDHGPFTSGFSTSPSRSMLHRADIASSVWRAREAAQEPQEE